MAHRSRETGTDLSHGLTGDRLSAGAKSLRTGGPASHSERPRVIPDSSGKVPLLRGKINIPAFGTAEIEDDLQPIKAARSALSGARKYSPGGCEA